MEELVTKKVEETVMTLDGFDSCTSNVYENYTTVMVSLDLDLSQEEVDKSFDDLRLKVDSLQATGGYSNIALQSELEKSIAQLDFPESVTVEKS